MSQKTKPSPEQPEQVAESVDSPEKVRWADRIALQIWIILFLLTVCFSLVKFLFGV